MISINAVAMQSKRLMETENLSQEEAVNRVLDGYRIEEENRDGNLMQRIYNEMNRDFEQEREQAEQELKQQQPENDQLITRVADQTTAENDGLMTEEERQE